MNSADDNEMDRHDIHDSNQQQEPSRQQLLLPLRTIPRRIDKRLRPSPSRYLPPPQNRGLQLVSWRDRLGLGAASKEFEYAHGPRKGNGENRLASVLFAFTKNSYSAIWLRGATGDRKSRHAAAGAWRVRIVMLNGDGSI